MITKEQFSIFEKQFGQAVSDKRIATFGDAAKYGMDWMYNSMQAEIDMLTAKLAMVEKSLKDWHNEALTLTDENRKLLYLLEKQKTETAEAYAEARRYHKAYHQLLEQLK